MLYYNFKRWERRFEQGKRAKLYTCPVAGILNSVQYLLWLLTHRKHFM